MFCCQCEQAAGGQGCTQEGMCGKSAEVSNLQDLLIYQLKGISIYAMEFLKNGRLIPKEYIAFIENALIQTLTNVNFEPQDHLRMLETSGELKEKIKAEWPELKTDRSEALYILGRTRSQILKDTVIAGIWYDRTIDEEIRSLREAIKQGVKGIAAYSHQARLLGLRDDRIDHFLCTALAATTDASLSPAALAALVLETGDKAALAIGLLNQANHQERKEAVRQDQTISTETIVMAAKSGEIKRFFVLEAAMMFTKGEAVILNVPRWFRHMSAS